MAGGMFAGHTESGGELVEGPDGKLFKEFYGKTLCAHSFTYCTLCSLILPLMAGMSSTVAMTKHSGGVASYRSSEGKAVSLPFRGPVSATINDILGGIRSTCTYVGAA